MLRFSGLAVITAGRAVLLNELECGECMEVQAGAVAPKGKNMLHSSEEGTAVFPRSLNRSIC